MPEVDSERKYLINERNRLDDKLSDRRGMTDGAGEMRIGFGTFIVVGSVSCMVVHNRCRLVMMGYPIIGAILIYSGYYKYNRDCLKTLNSIRKLYTIEYLLSSSSSNK